MASNCSGVIALPDPSVSRVVTAAVLLIGDEILSGRTKDANLEFIATFLGNIGIQVHEARVVSDERDHIADAVNALRSTYDYVFTTGGIGPTHDDITADSVAFAFGVPIGPHPEAMEILTRHYEETGGEFTEARQRMARIPKGAVLVANPISKAPGFQLENVFVMAGIPIIVQVMMDDIATRLEGGAQMISRTIDCQVGEGAIASELGDVQKRFPDVMIGSYPFFRDKKYGTSLVLRSVESLLLDEAVRVTVELVEKVGGNPVVRTGS
jgi:molybdenum cofactor synthesis domain-containing protein